MTEKSITVVKVRAHQDQEVVAQLPLELQAPARGNQAADKAAKQGVWCHEGLKDWLANNSVYLQL
eukprot:2502685-Prorocentrum_lima.AAC.1